MNTTILKRIQRGFSLIELMIAVAIVGVLAAIAYPAYTSQIQKGRLAECRGGMLQTMQQQERYYTQHNSYVSVSETTTTAVIKNFSGDTRDRSACTIRSETCADASLNTLARCIQLTGVMANSSGDISDLYLDSQGIKRCKLNGTVTTSANSKCWP